LGALIAALFLPVAAWAQDALPSWTDGPVKQAIVAYVAKVTAPGPGFVPEPERIAVFDNDGTLWPEQPLYIQFVFTLAEATVMAAKTPALRSDPAFAAAVSGDRAALAKLSEKQLLGLAATVQAGRSTEDFEAQAGRWLTATRHPRFRRPYAALAYQPQLELMALLKRSGFKVYIVSGGDVDFMRSYAEQAYGVPPEQVIGTSLKTRFEPAAARPEIVYEPEIASIDDGPGKPANIALHIGRTPILAVGNSDGDQQMLEYSAASRRPSLQILIRHDDEKREYAYDRVSSIGKLDKALDEAMAKGWTVVSMKRDWRTIFAPEPRR
jgi:phosphoglycolate phosphatase-like HAD superfamily hydrolase